MAYILEKIGNTYNLPKKYFTCDAKSDLDGISLIDVPIGSEAYCILEEESYILDSNKQWHKKKIGDDLTGQVQADLSQTDSTQADYVKGIIRKESLPEGYPYKGMKAILDGTFEFASSGGLYVYQIADENFVYVNGESYTIIWDGEVYQCIATTFNNIPILGNLSIGGAGANTGEPFLFIDYGNGQKVIGTKDASATHNITVGVEVIHSIAQELLPEIAIENGMVLKNLQATMPSSANWQSVTYGNDKFVATAKNSTQAAYSVDGITWTATTMPYPDWWLSVIYGNDKFVAVAYRSKRAAYSEDGINWTETYMPISADWTSLTYANGKFVAVAENTTAAAYSTDGITWTAVRMPSNDRWSSVTYGDGKFVAVVITSSQAAYSEDGITWTATTMPSSANWSSVTYGNGKFVAFESTDAVYSKAAYSEDGINWTETTMPSDVLPNDVFWDSVTYGNGKFVAVANVFDNSTTPGSTTAAYSADGITWTTSTLPSSAKWTSVIYGNGKFVTIAFDSDKSAYSEDGITWRDSFTYISQDGEDVTSNTLIALDHTHDEYATKTELATKADSADLESFRASIVQSDLSQTDSTQIDYVKGVIRQESLPEGYPYKQIGTILDGTFEFADMGGIYGCVFVDEDFTYVNGKSYTIIWDGVTYQCTATIFASSPDDNQLVLGNLGIMGMTDTGEPFLFVDQGKGQKAIGTNNTAATHTITVSGEVACPIAPEYLPEGYPHKEQSKTVFFKWNGYIGDKENIDVSNIIGQEAYYVKVSDTVLQKEAFVGAVITNSSGESITVSSENLIDDTGGYIVGSEAIIMVSDKDIFNFSGIKFPSNGLWTIKVIMNSGKQSYCASVIRTTKIIYPISEEYLPDKYVTETELASKGYLTSIPNEYVTETELASKGYLTAIPNEYITSLGNKQDKLTFDTKPTSGSTNPVTSGGIKSYVDAAQVQSDWSINDKSNSAYIKNRPFYDATSYTNIYVSSSKLPEATTLNEGTGLYYGTTNYNSPSLEVGQKYKFTYFNGNSNETFILTASSYKLSGEYKYVEVLGNAQLGADYGLIDTSYAQFPVSDTGEPFCFIVYRTSMNAIVARNKNSKLSGFYKVNEELVQLEVKYLPNHTHDFSELTITDLEAAKTALTIENGMILKNLQAVMPSNADWYSITYGNDKFVSVTSRNIAAYSKNGITWTVTTMPSSANWKSVTYGNDKFVAVAYESTKAAYSEDGINWTSATLPSSAKWCSVTYGNGKFVAMAYNSNVAAYSEDGITWTAITMSSAAKWRSVTYGNGKFVAVADEQTTAYSEDGITWTIITMPSFAIWKSVTYGNGKFVAVAQGTNAAYSEDGITWTDTTLPSFAQWISVTYGNGKFVAVADGQTTAYSEDGITWTVITIRNYAHWESIAYGNDKFVAVASNSTDTVFSFDGINWQTELNMITQNNSNVTENVRSAIGIPSYSTANNGQFLRVVNGIPTWTESLPTLTSPNGTKYQLAVSDDGTLSAVVVS